MVVTGGGSGIGAAIATGAAAEGGLVAVLDVDETAARAVADACGGNAIATRCNVADPDAVAAAFDAVDSRLGTVDVLVNNAGHAPARDPELSARAVENMQRAMAQQKPLPLEVLSALDPQEWDRMIRVHLYGTYYCAREAMKRMERGTGGVILNMASILGLAGSAGAPHYSAAKGGIIALTKSLALEGASAGVRVNAIAPGWIDTPMTQAVLTPELAAMMRAQIPMHRLGVAQEIAAVALHLCSDESSYTTGQVISVNGGLLMP